MVLPAGYLGSRRGRDAELYPEAWSGGFGEVDAAPTEGVGAGVGDDGEDVSLGEGDGLGVGEGVRLREGLGVDGDGLALGVGMTNSPRNGGGKPRTGIPAVTVDMKRCQISAGIDPPYTAEKPSMLRSGMFPRGYPTQTQVASWGTYPQNHAFV